MILTFGCYLYLFVRSLVCHTCMFAQYICILREGLLCATQLLCKITIDSLDWHYYNLLTLVKNNIGLKTFLIFVWFTTSLFFCFVFYWVCFFGLMKLPACLNHWTIIIYVPLLDNLSSALVPTDTKMKKLGAWFFVNECKRIILKSYIPLTNSICGWLLPNLHLCVNQTYVWNIAEEVEFVHRWPTVNETDMACLGGYYTSNTLKWNNFKADFCTSEIVLFRSWNHYNGAIFC